MRLAQEISFQRRTVPALSLTEVDEPSTDADLDVELESEAEEVETTTTRRARRPEALRAMRARVEMGTHHLRRGLEDQVPRVPRSPKRASDEIAVYTKNGGWKKVDHNLPTLPYPRAHDLVAPTKTAVEAKLKKGRWSNRRTPSTSPLPTEGLNRRVHTLHVGQFRDPIWTELARVGEHEGFRVVAHGRDVDNRWAKTLSKDHPNLQFVGHEGGQHYPWIEDNGEIAEDGTIRYPRDVSSLGVKDAIYADRMKRDPNYRKIEEKYLENCSGEDLKNDYKNIAYPRQGAVASQDAVDNSASMAVALKTDAHEMQTYIEGGNVLRLSAPNGKRFAVVGKDTIGIAKKTLEKDLGHPPNPREVTRAIARDLGVEPSHVIAVEQPRDFHIDMTMAPLQNGTMMVNDARISYANQKKWMYKKLGKAPAKSSKAYPAWAAKKKKVDGQLATLKTKYDEMAKAEDKVAETLRNRGVGVVRMGGRYYRPNDPKTEYMNFINGEGGTNAKGKRFLIALGGEPEAEAYAAEKLMEAGGLDRIYFSSTSVARHLLAREGGLSCAVKVQVHKK